MKTKITVFVSVLVLCAIMLMGENLDYQSYTHGTMDITTTGDMACSSLTVNGALAVSGGVDIDGTFEGDTLEANMHLNVDGTSQFDGRVDFDGSIDVGNSATNDTAFITARIGSDIDPVATDTYSFGSNSLRWDYWGGDLNISDSTVLGGTVDITGATDIAGAVTFGSTIAAGADAFPDTSINYAEECSIFVDGSFVNDDELASNDTTNWGIMADTALVYADEVRGELTDSVTAIVHTTVWDSLVAGYGVFDSVSVTEVLRMTENKYITWINGADTVMINGNRGGFTLNAGGTWSFVGDGASIVTAVDSTMALTAVNGITVQSATSFSTVIDTTLHVVGGDAVFGRGVFGEFGVWDSLYADHIVANVGFVGDLTGTASNADTADWAWEVDTTSVSLLAYLANNYQPLATLLTQLVACTDSATCATDTLFLWKGGKVAEIVFATP